MKRCFLTIVCLALVAMPALGQDGLFDRLKQIEANNSTLGMRMNAIEAKLDGLCTKIDKAVCPVPTTTAAGVTCQAGACQVQSAPMNAAACGSQMSASSCGTGGGLFARIRERRAARRGG